MSLNPQASGSIAFLLLYSINFAILIYGFSTRLIRFQSVYAVLLLHVSIRLAGQSVGVAFGAWSYFRTDLLVASIILSAEGYFSLVLCAYRFLIHYHQEAYPRSGSWLEGRPEPGSTFLGRLKRAFTAKDSRGQRDPWMMTQIHWTLIFANTILIVGGTMAINVSGQSEDPSRLQTSIALRSVGQAVFLLINILLMVFLLISRVQDSHGYLPFARFFRVAPDFGEADARAPTRRTSKTLRILIVVWFPLIARGVFGILQSAIPAINYSSASAYGPNGLSDTFVILENIFQVLPEWTSCCLLCTIMFVKERPDERKGSSAQEGHGPGVGQGQVEKANGATV